MALSAAPARHTVIGIMTSLAALDIGLVMLMPVHFIVIRIGVALNAAVAISVYIRIGM